jgi:hypothetical protein
MRTAASAGRSKIFQIPLDKTSFMVYYLITAVRFVRYIKAVCLRLAVFSAGDTSTAFFVSIELLSVNNIVAY